MSLFAVSDLHISSPDDPLYLSLVSLLQDRASAGDIIVLAGDLFDLFVGNKEVFKSRYATFLNAISSAGTRGVEIHYIEGNHDFQVGAVFRKMHGVQVHPYDVEIESSGKRFYFAHGDLVDRGDYKYRFLRGFFRSPFMKAAIFLMPGEWIDGIGKWSSRLSKKKSTRLPSSLPIQRMEHLRKVYRSYAAECLARGFDFVVMGHCHDLDEMFFNIGGRRGQYINVGFPRVHGSFLSWSPGEEKIHRERLPNHP